MEQRKRKSSLDSSLRPVRPPLAVDRVSRPSEAVHLPRRTTQCASLHTIWPMVLCARAIKRTHGRRNTIFLRRNRLPSLLTSFSYFVSLCLRFCRLFPLRSPPQRPFPHCPLPLLRPLLR